jgi:hypothetical protein
MACIVQHVEVPSLIALNVMLMLPPALSATMALLLLDVAAVSLAIISLTVIHVSQDTLWMWTV